MATTDTVQATTDRVREAEAHEQQMRDALAAIEEQVRSGAEVDPAELTTADALIRSARLRVEAAQREAEQARTAARHRQYADAVTAALVVADEDTTAVADAHTDAVKALQTLVQFAADRERQLRDAMTQVRAAIRAARDHREEGMLADLGVPTDPHGQAQQHLMLSVDGHRRQLRPVPWPLLALNAVSQVWEDACQVYAREYGTGAAADRLPSGLGRLDRLTGAVRTEYDLGG